MEKDTLINIGYENTCLLKLEIWRVSSELNTNCTGSTTSTSCSTLFSKNGYSVIRFSSKCFHFIHQEREL